MKNLLSILSGVMIVVLQASVINYGLRTFFAVEFTLPQIVAGSILLGFFTARFKTETEESPDIFAVRVYQTTYCLSALFLLFLLSFI